MISDLDDEYIDVVVEPKKKGDIYHMYCQYRYVCPEDYHNLNCDKEFLANLDEDGNHPIKLNGKEYLVIGHYEYDEYDQEDADARRYL